MTLVAISLLCVSMTGASADDRHGGLGSLAASVSSKSSPWVWPTGHATFRVSGREARKGRRDRVGPGRKREVVVPVGAVVTAGSDARVVVHGRHGHSGKGAARLVVTVPRSVPVVVCAAAGSHARRAPGARQPEAPRPASESRSRSSILERSPVLPASDLQTDCLRPSLFDAEHLPPDPGSDPHDARTTASWAGVSCLFRCAAPSSSACRIALRRARAERPRSRRARRSAAASMNRAIGMSSKPATAMSSGTRTPASRKRAQAARSPSRRWPRRSRSGAGIAPEAAGARR